MIKKCRVSLRLRMFSVAPVLAVLGCSGEYERGGGEPLGEVVEPLVRMGSIVANARLPKGKWRREGRIPRAEAWEKVGRPSDEEGPNRADIQQRANERMAIGDENGDVYSVEFTAEELAEISNALELRGFAEENVGDVEHKDEDGLVPKNWVNGTDNRLRYGIAEAGTTGDLARVGWLTNGCTATFIGTPESDYYVITAAHCLFAEDTGTWMDPNFEPRRDACRTSIGGAIAGCDTRPYGTWNGGQWMTSQDYLDNCRGTSASNMGSTYCTARDMAVIRVTRPAGENFPGAHGFGAFSETSTPTLYHRGYPSCYDANDNPTRAPDAPGGSVQWPNVCRYPTVYGRSNGGWGNPYEGNRGMRMSLTTSAGHSGAPHWLVSSGARVAAVHSAGVSGCAPSGATNCARPSRGPRITSDFYAWTLDFMGI